MRWLFGLLAILPALAGCAVPPTPAVGPYTHETDPVTGRGYYLYVPTTYNSHWPAPLIVTCHGTPPYDVADMHIREWKWYGEKNGCIVIAPELIATDGIFGDGPITGMVADERYILSIVSQLGYRYNIDRNNILITGFSGGGFPTYWVGLRHPDIFSVVVARNCNFSESNLDGWWSPDALRTPIKIYYGDRDPAAIKLQSERGIDYLRSRGFSVETEILANTGHERHPEIAMDFFKRHLKPARPTFPNK